MACTRIIAREDSRLLPALPGVDPGHPVHKPGSSALTQPDDARGRARGGCLPGAATPGADALDAGLVDATASEADVLGSAIVRRRIRCGPGRQLACLTPAAEPVMPTRSRRAARLPGGGDVSQAAGDAVNPAPGPKRKGQNSPLRPGAVAFTVCPLTAKPSQPFRRAPANPVTEMSPLPGRPQSRGKPCKGRPPCTPFMHARLLLPPQWRGRSNLLCTKGSDPLRALPAFRVQAMVRPLSCKAMRPATFPRCRAWARRIGAWVTRPDAALRPR